MRFVSNPGQLILIITFLLAAQFSFAQKERVGVVLSGGGAAGLAHIGVLKALEENHIPIDYITGTSAGALIGCLYSLGYTPLQMEKLVNSQEFRNLTYGNLEKKYVYYFKREEDNASWASFKLSFDTSLVTNLPTNITSSVPMDFALLELTAKGAAVGRNNFDSLFIPFRCLAADVEAKKTVVFRKGDLAQAVRASMSYPFYLHPITVDGKILFDGGLYNNFPTDIMYKEFYPDILIGSNVASKWHNPDEDNLISQLRALLMSETNFASPCENGIIIEPGATDVGLFDFDHPQPVIDSGYAAAMRDMPRIKASLSRRISTEELQNKRNTFQSREKPLVFDNIQISGVNEKQAYYIRNSLRHKYSRIPLEKLKTQYMRLSQDEKFKSLYPFAKYNEVTGFYDFSMRIKKEKPFSAEFGGNFSNRPINEAYIGLQYHYTGKIGVAVSGDGYYGKLYSSAQVKTRIDFPLGIPLYIEPNLTYNRFDFFKSSNAFFEDNKPPYLISNDQYAELNIGIPAGNHGKFLLGGGIAQATESYYQTTSFSQRDTADKTFFDFYTLHLGYELNTLNQKQYANEGSNLIFNARFSNGIETYEKGSTAAPAASIPYVAKDQEFVVFKAKFDKYFRLGKHYAFGIYGEGVYSTQPVFNNYTATTLSSPVFQPTPESMTLFLEDFRAHKFAGFGTKSVLTIAKKIDLRLEAYVFLPYQSLQRGPNQQAQYGGVFETKHYVGEAAIVYHTPLGPVCASINYFDTPVQNQFSFMLHFGYILFNKRAVD